MKQFFDKIRWGMARFFQGRYGTDPLNQTLLLAGVACCLLSYVDRLRWLVVPAYALLIYSLVRSLSRNLEKRRAELKKFMELKGRITGWWQLRKRAFKERKTHRYFRCKQCRTTLRVPRGKGKIAVTCPRCGTKAVHKS